MPRCSHDACGRMRPDFLLRYMRLGLRVDDAWFCSPSCVEAATAERLREGQRDGQPLRPVPALRLGVLLLHGGAVTSANLEQALRAQRATGRRLGDELVRRGAVASHNVLKALATQAGARYLSAVDPACVRQGPGGLSRDEVRALGVVPIQLLAADRIVLVACPAPLPRASLSALRQLTGWTPEPLLVTDDDLTVLMEQYGAARTESPQQATAFAVVGNIADAAAKVAAAAVAERSVTVTEAHADRSIWLRINGPNAITTVLMPKEGTEWLAATTSR
jgi:hypothetical protein